MSEKERRPVKRALVSVYDKTGLDRAGRRAARAGVEVVSTGSTARTIADAGVPVTPVEQLTGFPECLDGRVKTLHPRVHAGLLADTRKPEHLAQLAELGIAPFELVVSNLYPFTATVASGRHAGRVRRADRHRRPRHGAGVGEEPRQRGGRRRPGRYDGVLESVKDGGFTPADRRALAATAFRHTATYDVAVASYLGNVIAPNGNPFPGWVGATWERDATLRYGENPHQAAALYARGGRGWPSRSSCRQGDVLQQLRRRRRRLAGRPRPRRRALRRGDQARQPVRDRGRRGRRGGAPQGPRHRPHARSAG